jgi:hypothetical protein
MTHLSVVSLSLKATLKQNINSGKSKVHSATCHEGTKAGERYSFTLSLTSALNGGGWLTP